MEDINCGGEGGILKKEVKITKTKDDRHQEETACKIMFLKVF